jgi:hypothetical protein
MLMFFKGEAGREFSGKGPQHSETFLVECLAWGLLRAYGVAAPPVPVREMIRNALPVFERLSLLELDLGLYDAVYRPLLDGSRLIAVDLAKSHAVQRASMARELYVAFCRSPRAVELGWPCYEHPYAYGELFARCLLMPDAWVRQACIEGASVEQLAAHFQVPVRMVVRRLSELGLQAPGLAASHASHDAEDSPGLE